MITQEDIEAMGYTSSDFEAVRKDVDRALHGVQSAKHWLDETGGYESDVLNDAYENIKMAERQLLRVLSEVN
jgi:hypothetical protein